MHIGWTFLIALPHEVDLLYVCCQSLWIRFAVTWEARLVCLQGKVNILTDVQEYLSHVEMLHLYRSAQVYVSPFRSEGFGLGTLEAMAMGLQACCSRALA